MLTGLIMVLSAVWACAEATSDSTWLPASGDDQLAACLTSALTSGIATGRA